MSEHTCRHVHGHTTEICGINAVVVFDVGFDGLGACRRHAGQMLLWCMDGERSAPETIITTVPAWRWRQYKE